MQCVDLASACIRVYLCVCVSVFAKGVYVLVVYCCDVLTPCKLSIERERVCVCVYTCGCMCVVFVTDVYVSNTTHTHVCL